MDQTGPLGEGPMTGRAMGRCNPEGSEQMRAGFGVGRGGAPRGGGRGWCFGGGRGRPGRFGHGRRGAGAPAVDAETDDLRNEVRTLTEEVSRLRAELEQQKGGSGASAAD
jgi:hypothetical protein